MPILSLNFIPMKKQTNKNNKTESAKIKRSKALKNKSDTRVPDSTRKAVREAKKRLRYYFLTKKQRQEVEKGGLGWESAIKSLSSVDIVLSSLFIAYVSKTLGLTLHQCRNLFLIMSITGGTVTTVECLRLLGLTNYNNIRDGFRLQVDYLIKMGFVDLVSSHCYKASDYSYYVLEQLLKDFKDLHISAPPAVDSRHA